MAVVRVSARRCVRRGGGAWVIHSVALGACFLGGAALAAPAQPAHLLPRAKAPHAVLSRSKVAKAAVPVRAAMKPSHRGGGRPAKFARGPQVAPQIAVTPGDPLLKGAPAGWGSHVLGTGTAQPGGDIAVGQGADLSVKGHGSGQSNIGGASTAYGAGNGKTVGKGSGGAFLPPSRNRILLPVPGKMGVAAYRSGDRLVFVVDAAEPMDISALRGDGIFSHLSVATLPDVTIITLPLPDTRQLFLSQQSDGWVLGDQPPPGVDYTERREINPKATIYGLLFPMRRPGRVFSIKDPASGAYLVIGTTALDDGGMLSLREGDSYDVWPSMEGVVIADHAPPKVEMHPVMRGDLLTVAGKQISDLDQAVYASDVDLKWLGLRHISDEEANERYRKAVLAAADADPKDKFAKRYIAAQAALGAGAFPDARAIMNVALGDDPEEAFRPDVGFFLGVVDFLTGHMEAAATLANQWPEHDLRATKLWKGLYYAANGGHDGEAARLIARDMPRLLNYPESLRSILLPLASEHIARYGNAEDRRALGMLPEGAAYRLAHAINDIRNGQRDDAVKLLEALSVDPDVAVAEKAMEEGIALSLREGRIPAAKAAKQFASLMPDARLVGRADDVNIAQADAHMQTSAWDEALRALDQIPPTSSPRIQAELQPMLHHILADIAQRSVGTEAGEVAKPVLLHNTALLKAHLPLLPSGPQKGELLVAYGRMLDDLGLAEEGGQMVSLAIPMLNDPSRKAAAGDVLADNYVRRGLFDQATKVLADTTNSHLAAEVAAQRSRVVARMAIATGKPEIALYLLNADHAPEAADMRARIHENRDEWSPAVADVRHMADVMIPDHGQLTMAQQLLALRLASDATRAGDAATIAWIREKVGNRKFADDTGNMFRLLVSSSQGL